MSDTRTEDEDFNEDLERSDDDTVIEADPADLDELAGYLHEVAVEHDKNGEGEEEEEL